MTGNPNPPANDLQQQQAIIDGLDHFVRQIEQTWGIGRLRLLVSDFLRIKFDAQSKKLNEAITAGNTEFISVQAEGMKRAWTYLDKSAREAGHRPLDPHVWEILIPCINTAVALVQTETEAHALSRDRVVFTTAEIGVLLERSPDAVDRIKQRYPQIIMTKSKPFDWSRGDEIPF